MSDIKRYSIKDLEALGEVECKVVQEDTGKTEIVKINFRLIMPRLRNVMKHLRSGSTAPFGGFISEIIWTIDPRVQTACTDGVRVYFNPIFADQLITAAGSTSDTYKSQWEKSHPGLRYTKLMELRYIYRLVLFVLIHEIYHMVYRHCKQAEARPETRGGRDHYNVNYSMDAEINRDIENHMPEFKGCTDAAHGVEEGLKRFPAEIWSKIYTTLKEEGHDAQPPKTNPQSGQGLQQQSGGQNLSSQQQQNGQQGGQQQQQQSPAQKAQEAAQRAKDAAQRAQECANNGDEQGAKQATQEAADAAREAAEQAQQAAQNAQQNAQDSASRAQQAANEAQECANNGDEMGARQSAQDAADATRESANQAQETANNSQDSQSAQDAQNAADQANSAADNAELTAKDGNASAQDIADAAQQSAEAAQQASQEASNSAQDTLQSADNANQAADNAEQTANDSNASSQDAADAAQQAAKAAQQAAESAQQQGQNGQPQGEGEGDGGQQGSSQGGDPGGQSGQGSSEQGEQSGQGGSQQGPIGDPGTEDETEEGSSPREPSLGGGDPTKHVQVTISTSEGMLNGDMISVEDGLDICDKEDIELSASEKNMSPIDHAESKLTAAKQALKGVGKGALARKLLEIDNSLLVPVIDDWKDRMKEHLVNAGGDNDKKVIKKRRFGTERYDRYTPAKYVDAPSDDAADVFYLVDASGSISDDILQRVFSEIIAMEREGDMHISKSCLTYFSTYIDEDRIREWYYETDEIEVLEMILREEGKDAGGGTDIPGCINAVIELDDYYRVDDPHTVLIVFTDGEDSLGTINDLDFDNKNQTIFAIMNSKNRCESIQKELLGYNIPEANIITIDTNEV